MIPLRLQIKNFLSYGDTQTIDFSPHNLICLSGKNGHGKSALLDAITWALWGQARKTITSTRPDQGLLKLGQNTMMVCLDFIFNGQEYRVRREFSSIMGKIATKIDFGMLDAANDKVVPLTGKSSRETQETIERILNLDFESFAHSSFLRQGQASEFSKKAPKERKEILAAILGLKKYENIRQAALDKARDTLNQKASRMTLLEKNLEQLEHKETVTQDFLNTQAALEETKKALIAADQHLNELNSKGKLLSNQRREREVLELHHNQIVKDRATTHEAFFQEATLWRSTHRKLRALADPQQVDRRRQELLTAIATHQETLQKHLNLKQELFEVSVAATTRTTSLSTLCLEKRAALKTVLEQTVALQKEHEHKHFLLVTQLEKNTREITELAATSAKAGQELNARRTLYEKAQKQEEQFEKRKAFYQRYGAHGTFVKSELVALERKQYDLHDDAPTSCPLCEQNLSAARKRFLSTKVMQQHQALKHRLARLSTVLGRLKEILIAQHAELLPLKKAREEASIIEARLADIRTRTATLATEKRELETQIAALTQQINDCAHKADTLTEEYRQSEQAMTKELANDPELEQLRTKRGMLELLLASTIYNKEAHEAALREQATLAQEHAYMQQLKEEAAQQLSRKNRLTEMRTTLSAHTKTLAALQEKLAHYVNLEAQERDLNTQILSHQEQIKTLLKRQEELVGEHARLALRQETLAVIEKECAEERSRLATLDELAADFQALALATGKDGIQALIIEQALPEIESEANALLARLTNNQAHITIESLRDLKKGGSKETLDINISDSLGVRPYELYSGGEAFRIDFAIRIAISKLLARRAGTSLQTLIIDEGFGSQDEEGLSKIMEAIYAIQEDFAKIIIVSHLPSMKDQFPVHLMVEKEPSGSKVHVFRQG